MTDLRELEKRLEEATGEYSDMELDVAIAEAVGIKVEQNHYTRYTQEWAPFVFDWMQCNKHPLPRFSESLDAAVALVERCLPTAFPTIDRYSISDEPTAAQYNWRVWIKWAEGDDAIREAFSGTKSSPALALCLALIRALIAKGDHNE